MPNPSVFISYCHKDEKYKDQLVTHLGVLQKQKLLSIWDDRQIAGGDDWLAEIEQAIESAAVAVLMISAEFLTSDFILNEEVPQLLARRASHGLRVMPLIVKPCAWQLVDWLEKINVRPKDGNALTSGDENRFNEDLTAFTVEINQILTQLPTPPAPPTPSPSQKIDLSHLPNTGSDIFGREAEVAILDQAWQTPQTRLISFIAWGGVGKSALTNHWLGKMAGDNYRGAVQVYGWSFYSQGTKQSRQVSADTFIHAAFKWFGYQGEIPQSGHEKGVALAQLIGQSRTLLVLDGLEPMQFPPGVNDGKLKDQSMIALLKNLASANNGLCIVTSRKRVADLSAMEKSTAPCYELGNLSDEAGVQVLKNAGITGPEAELKKAVQANKGHALALNLLASFLGAVYDGDIRKRDIIESLYDDEDKGAHAKNIMASYEIWFAENNQPELDILTLLGLFDRPASKAAIDVLKAEPAIAGVSERLQKLSLVKWQYAVKRLRELQLLAMPENKEIDSLDCHPLIREHFGEQLQQQNPDGFKAAHGRLYEYYKNLPEKPLPDTLEEMEPLFIAVTHGCLAGLYQAVFDDVFWHRINRKNEYYILRQLGAFDSFISVLANFFAEPWQLAQAELADDLKAVLFNQAGTALRAVGRLAEAIEPMEAGLGMEIEQKHWKYAAINASNLSQLSLTIGKVAAAVNYGEQSVTLADKSGDDFEMEARRTTHADALHQAGQAQAAKKRFIEAEQMQQKSQPDYAFLYSVRGFLFCDLLLALGQTENVLARVEKTLKWAFDNNASLLDISLNQLTFGKALMQQAIAEHSTDFDPAMSYLHQAVAGLRDAGSQHHIPRGLLARASLYRVQGDFDKAWLDLEEVRDIAEQGHMQLFMTDYHLEACRTLLVQGLAAKQAEFDEHLKQATQLIEQTGYHRRDDELAALLLEMSQ